MLALMFPNTNTFEIALLLYDKQKTQLCHTFSSKRTNKILLIFLLRYISVNVISNRYWIFLRLRITKSIEKIRKCFLLINLHSKFTLWSGWKIKIRWTLSSEVFFMYNLLCTILCTWSSLCTCYLLRCMHMLRSNTKKFQSVSYTWEKERNQERCK